MFTKTYGFRFGERKVYSLQNRVSCWFIIKYPVNLVVCIPLFLIDNQIFTNNLLLGYWFTNYGLKWWHLLDIPYFMCECAVKQLFSDYERGRNKKSAYNLVIKNVSTCF